MLKKRNNQVGNSLFLILLSVVVIYVVYNYQHYQPICSPHIQPLHSYDDLHLSCDVNTLITFDVDNTLIMSADPQQFSYNFSNIPLAAKIYAVLRYPSLITHYEYATSLLFAQSPRKVTEPVIVSIINQLKQQCTVVGLTSMESGHWGTIESMPKWRYQMLASMEILFSDVPDQTFDQLRVRRGTHPVLYKGILCTNQEQKGAVLGTYIDSLENKPTHIISFDDDYDALSSIEKMCNKRGIAFQGYHYVYVTHQKKMLKFNQSLMLLNRFMKKEYY